MDWETSTLFDEYDKVLNEALEDLSLPYIYKTFFLHHVFADLKDINAVNQKEKLKKYACILQKQYPFDFKIEEIHLRRMIKHVVPKMFLQSDETSSNETTLAITQTDKDIVQYLSGAILKWEIKKLTKEESNWCRTLISKTTKLSDHFRKMDRSLIVPYDTFFSLCLQCEENYKKLQTKRKISSQLVVDTVFEHQIPIRNSNKSAVKKVLGRYIRMRAHISAKHQQKLSLQKKQVNKAKEKTTSVQSKKNLSLRSVLKKAKTN